MAPTHASLLEMFRVLEGSKTWDERESRGLILSFKTHRLFAKGENITR
jgi:hypothetical protein